MLESILRFSLARRGLVLSVVAILIGLGLWNFTRLPIDAVPDITNSQVQVITNSPSMAPQEVEQFITLPIEMAMANIRQRFELAYGRRGNVDVESSDTNFTVRLRFPLDENKP